MALDEPHHRLFIGCRIPAKMQVIETDTGKTVAAVEIPGTTDDLFFDAARGRIYVLGGEGYVDVYTQKDADHYERMARVAVPVGSRTGLYVPDMNELLRFCVAKRQAAGRAAGPRTRSSAAREKHAKKSRAQLLLRRRRVRIRPRGGGLTHESISWALGAALAGRCGSANPLACRRRRQYSECFQRDVAAAAGGERGDGGVPGKILTLDVPLRRSFEEHPRPALDRPADIDPIYTAAHGAPAYSHYDPQTQTESALAEPKRQEEQPKKQESKAKPKPKPKHK